MRARNQELEHEKHLENASLALISDVEEAAAARSNDNGSRAESAPSRGLIWKGDDENGWLTKIENRYYSVTRYMGQGTGRGKNKNPGHFIYTACCLDIRRLEENPKLISQYGERIEPSNLPIPIRFMRAWAAPRRRSQRQPTKRRGCAKKPSVGITCRPLSRQSPPTMQHRGHRRRWPRHSFLSDLRCARPRHARLAQSAAARPRTQRHFRGGAREERRRLQCRNLAAADRRRQDRTRAAGHCR